jgi:hypothetical protein
MGLAPPMNLPTRGAEVEAHTGAIRVPTQTRTRPRRSRLVLLRERIRTRRSANAARVQAMRANRSLPGSIPGSEHTHLLPPKAY